jgi:DNA-binding NarL/FixJ family response regulator
MCRVSAKQPVAFKRNEKSGTARYLNNSHTLGGQSEIRNAEVGICRSAAMARGEADINVATRLLIVDNHPLTRWALGRMVEEQPDLALVAETGSAEEARRLTATLAPDVVTVGITLADGNGLNLARDLRDRHESVGIVILTTRNEDDVLFRAMETGASAFVSKQAAIPEILGAIRHAAVAARSFSAAGLADALRRRQQAQERLALSPRELQILRLMVDGQSVPAMATSLYISLSTAKTYVARLYDKLGAANRAQTVMAAVRGGLVDPADAMVAS